MAHENIVNTQSRFKYFTALAWPVAAEGFFMHLLSSLDLIMAGTLGSAAQAAIGIVGQPRMMALLIVRAFATALTAVIARRYGQRRYGEMNSVYNQAITITGVFYLIFIGACLVLLPQILTLAGAQPSYLAQAHSYGRFVFIGLYFTALSTIINAGLIGVGKTKIIFIANVSGNVLNCALNYCFIFGFLFFPKLGVMGVGIATMLGNILSLAISLTAVAREGLELSFTGLKKPIKEDLGPIFKVFSGSLPEQFFERLGMFLYTMMVAQLGVVEMAVHHIVMNLCDIFWTLSNGLSTATASTTGQCLGHKEEEVAYDYGIIGQKVALACALVGFLVFGIFRTPIFKLFSSDPAAIAISGPIMVINAIVSFPQALALVNSGVLKGAGDTRYVAAYSFIIIAIFRPIITYILVFRLGLGLTGAWIALLADQSLRALAATTRFYSRKWQAVSL